MRTIRKTAFPCALLAAFMATFMAVSLIARAQEEIDPAVGAGTIANDGPLPTGGVSLLGGDPLRALKLEGRRADRARVEVVPVTGQPFGVPSGSKALRVTTTQHTPDDAVLLTAPLTSPYQGNDTLFLRLYWRVLQTSEPNGEAAISLVVQGNEPPFPTAFFGGRATSKGSEWRRFDLPVPAWRSFPVGKSRFAIKLGGAPRIVELAGLQVLTYGQKVLPHQLPYRRATYEGRSPNAPWRRAALARIEKFRKGNLTVKVVDAAGRRVAGAEVAVRMKRHAYGWGTAVNNRLVEPGPQKDRYRAAVKELFNVAVLENGHKWGSWNNPQNREKAQQSVAWLRANGLNVRGHTAVYPRWQDTPPAVRREYEERVAREGESAAKAWLRATIDAHIAEKVGGNRGQLIEWDAVNEAIGNSDLVRILGRDEIVHWFRQVRQADPNVPLYLNENSVENGSKTEAFEKELQFLLDKDAPLGGIGLQGHVGAIPIPRIQSNIERFARFNLPIKITEFDIVTPDEQLQGDFTRDFLTLVFSIPQSDGFLMWGFWDGAHWLGDAPVYYRDWTLKPSGRAYKDLVFKQWWTNANGQTDAKGKYQVRGFLGDYEITVTRSGQSKIVAMSLPRNGRVVTVALS